MVLKFFILVLFAFPNLCNSKSNEVDVCSMLSDNRINPNQLKELVYSSVKPEGGRNAGKYSKIKVDSWNECIAQCCEFDRCNVAYWISSICFHIECLSDELCAPITGDNSDINDQTLYLKIRSVRKTAAAIDFEDPGQNECNATKPCSVNEQCERVSINAQLKRNVCLCDRENGYRRINGVCRQYLPRTQPCALYETDYENNDDTDPEENNRGRCRKNEECLPPNDRAKHGYCQCKLGFTRKNENGKCLSEDLSTKSPSVSVVDFEIQAGEDQTITLPTNQVDLYGHVLYKSNKSEIDVLTLKNLNLTVSWSLKSSTNNAKIDITNPDDAVTHVLVKQLQEGNYEFELKLNNDQGTTLATDSVKVEVLPVKATVPLLVKVTSPVNVHLPQQVVKLQSAVEPSNRRVTYQWTYAKDGPVTPTLENVDTSDLLVSNLRPGEYSFRLRVTDDLNNEQIKTVRLIATGEPIEARVTNSREIVFWPSTDVLLDGTSSILEQQTTIYWSLISNDNKQKASDIEIATPHALKTHVSNLRMGQYKFQLSLTTKDREYTSVKEVLVIVYSQNGQPPKINVQLETKHVNILNNLLILNATGTTADYGIAKWEWIKSPLSPAMGYFINDSKSSPIAYLTNLIEGQYIFTLQVTDDRQQMSEKNVTVDVDGIPDAENLIEVNFLSNPYLHQRTLENLLAQIRVFLIDVFPNINILMIGMPNANTLLLKGKDLKTDLTISPKSIVLHLQDKIKSLRSASNMNILSIETYLCLSNCSNNGKCDNKSKHCICNRYYMENWFKSFVYKEPNCDFLIHYFVLSAIAGSVFFVIFCWLCLCCCLRWRRRRNLLERRKRIRYQLLHEDDDDNDEISERRQKPKNKSRSNKGKSSTIIMSESDYELSDEQTLYEKPFLTAQITPTVKTRGLKFPVQDSNGSPMVPFNGQSPNTTDNSVA